MKCTTIIAAGLTLGLLAAAPATAQGRGHGPDGDRHDQNWSNDRHDRDGDRHGQDWRGDRRDHDWDRDRHDRGRHEGWRTHYDRGHHYGWRNRSHCTWTWRHHRRVRVCW